MASMTSEPRAEATKAQAETTETAAGAAVIEDAASATNEGEASSARATGNAENQDDSTGGDDNERVARAQSMTSDSTAVTTAVSGASACADDGRVGTTAVDAVVHHDDNEEKAPVPKIASTSDASDVRSDQAASAPTETATADAGLSTSDEQRTRTTASTSTAVKTAVTTTVLTATAQPTAAAVSTAVQARVADETPTIAGRDRDGARVTVSDDFVYAAPRPGEHRVDDLLDVASRAQRLEGWSREHQYPIEFGDTSHCLNPHNVPRADILNWFERIRAKISGRLFKGRSRA
ncbi:hypothetical protein ATCC90586_003460 [Pythium insidiosum]|nr:hypothetical protein ATCC90586_003460 [Pythium insidiosum]